MRPRANRGTSPDVEERQWGVGAPSTGSLLLPAVVGYLVYELVVAQGLVPPVAELFSRITALPMDGRPVAVAAIALLTLARLVRALTVPTYILGPEALELRRGRLATLWSDRPSHVVVPYASISDIRSIELFSWGPSWSPRWASAERFFSGSPALVTEVIESDAEDQSRGAAYHFAPSGAFRREFRQRWERAQRKAVRARPFRPLPPLHSRRADRSIEE